MEKLWCSVLVGWDHNKHLYLFKIKLKVPPPSSSKKCLSGRQADMQSADPLVGMRGRVVCHQHNSDRTEQQPKTISE